MRTLTIQLHNDTTAPSAHASYKGYGYGCNNAKPPWPPHRNTMIDVVVLGCGPIRTGEGAAALFIGVHILGEIWFCPPIAIRPGYQTPPPAEFRPEYAPY